MTTARAGYHHGALRPALVETAVALARAGGPDAVVVREAARRLAVSPTAAYRHFRDRDDLLLAVRTEAARTLAGAMAATAQRAGGEGAQERALLRFRAMGEGYVAFALGEPGLFRTLGAGPLEGAPPLALPPEEDPLGLLAGALDRLVEVGVLPAASRPDADVVAWTSVHGLSVLLLDGHLPRDRAEALRDRVLDAVALGLLPR